MRTYEEIDPVNKKTAKYKNNTNPDNALVYDFSNNPFIPRFVIIDGF